LATSPRSSRWRFPAARLPRPRSRPLAAPSPKAFRLSSLIKDEGSRNSVSPQLFLLIFKMRTLFGLILTLLWDWDKLRICFGLFLKIMVRMKSYILPELRYLTNQSIKALNYNSFEVYPQMSIVYKQRTLFIGRGGVFWEGMIVWFWLELEDRSNGGIWFLRCENASRGML